MDLRRSLLVFCLIPCVYGSHPALGAVPPAEALSRLQAGEPVELIVEYESTAIERAASASRSRNRQGIDDDQALADKAARYRQLKNQADAAGAHPEIDHLADYSHLPMSFKRFRSAASLNKFLARPEVKAVYLNSILHPVLAQSLPLIGQPSVMAAGEGGSGTTIAVIDNGIDYSKAAFGSCTAPGVPAGCHVSASVLFGSGTTDNSHGTNVSAIVLGVAPDSRIAMLNAFSGTGAYTSDIISAINWSISNRTAYNIVAINMSLGDGSKNTAPCQNNNSFYTPITNARNAGISVVAAAGNDTYTNALGKPACTPGAISVGAVYDSAMGSMSWATNPNCTDAVTAADLVTCFSDSASFLTLLAPGAMITAAGITEAGTSQASPHVAGAVAVLRSAFSGETLSQTLTRLTGTGVLITDPRNGIVTPRINLLEAARPANNAFASRIPLGGNTGSAKGMSLLATKETGEPNHAGNIGGHSVWWKWVAPGTGQFSLDTHGSGFDTLLAVYTGSSVGALTQTAANDNDGTAGNTSGILFQAQSGVEYEIAVDGANGAAGAVTLNWSLNTAAQANLSVGLSGPANGTDGFTAAYTLSVNNAGPQAATNVSAAMTLPAGTSYVSGPAGCSAAGSVITCNLGTLANGATANLSIQVSWNTASGTVALSATATSDLPDPSTGNNSSSFNVVVDTGDNADVPTLPEWATLLLAILLMLSSVKHMRQRRDS